MTVINTNVGALTARTYAVKAGESMQKSMERLSSGLRINSAADDAAGLAVANKMESQLRGMNVAIRNSQDGISLVQTAEAGMGEITNMIIRMRELAVQMNNGVYTDSDRTNAQLEVTALLAEIDKIAVNTAFNDVKVLDGSYTADIRAGNTNAEVINVAIKRMNTDSLGGNTLALDSKATASVKADNTISSKESSIALTVTESAGIVIKQDTLSTSLQNIYDADLGHTIAVSDTTNFTVSGGDITANLSYQGSADDTYKFTAKVLDSDGNTLYTDNITLTVEENTSTTAVVKSSETDVEIDEAATVTIQAVNTAGNTDGVLSSALQAFVTADSDNAGAPQGKFAIANKTGNGAFDAVGAGFTVDASGTITGPVNFEADGAETDFILTYTSSTGDVFTETVAVNVADNAADDGAASGYVRTGVNSVSTAALKLKNDEASHDLVFNGNNADTADQYLSADMKVFIGANAGGDFAVTNIKLAGADTTDVTWDDSNSKIAISDTTITGSLTFDIAYTNAAGDETWTESVTIAVTGDGNAVTHTNSGADDTQSNTSKLAVSVNGSASTSVAWDVAAQLTTSRTDTEAAAIWGDDTKTGQIRVNNIKDSDGAAVTGSPIRIESKTATQKMFFDNDLEPGTYTFDIEVDGTDNTFADVIYTETVTLTVTASTENATDTATNTANDRDASTNGTATTDLTGAYADQSTEEVSVVNNSMTVQEAATVTIDASAFSSAMATFVGLDRHAGGKYSLSGDDAETFKIDAATGTVTNKGLMDFETRAKLDSPEYSFSVVYTDANGATFTENVTLTLTDSDADDGTHLADVDVSSQEGSAEAVTILDTALNQISASQAELGAIQNRLSHNIDNLSKGSMLTETARGRIVDADFARETSELSKQQILGQAATSMLAQANQSKQSVLALLQ